MQGSTEKEGYLYHPPLFPVEGKKFCRNDNRERADMFIDLLDWNHKGVLDLGCNVGYFSLLLAMEGARVVGVDSHEEALKVAYDQAKEYWIENVSFQAPDQERRYLKDKDVLIALSVTPWIYETEPDAEAYIEQLFQIPIAIVEIQYPPDGRASVPGVFDDASCKQFLERYYPHVRSIGITVDHTEGITRSRTMWLCQKGPTPTSTVFGSQATIEFDADRVTKRAREGKQYDPIKEGQFLRIVQDDGISPEFIDDSDGLVMERIDGVPITASDHDLNEIAREFDHIMKVLKAKGVSHNDIRPSNIMVDDDGQVFLLDYGWATMQGEKIPDQVKGRLSDAEALERIEKLIIPWRGARGLYS